jgi:hypothetical protein
MRASNLRQNIDFKMTIQLIRGSTYTQVYTVIKFCDTIIFLALATKFIYLIFDIIMATLCNINFFRQLVKSKIQIKK